MRINTKNVQMYQKSRMQALDRLTSGKRVDDAKDDAGGLNVSSHMAAKEASLKVALRNISDAISMAALADSGMQEVAENLYELRRLATLAASGHLTDSDRALIQKEFTARLEQIQTICKSTEYNGIKCLNKPSDGSPSWTELVTHSLSSFSGVSSQSGANTVATVGGRTALLQTGNNDHLWFDLPAFSKSCTKVSVDMYLPSASTIRGSLSAFGTQTSPTSQVGFQDVEFGNDPYPLRRAGQHGQLYGQDFGPIVEDGWVTMSIEVYRNTNEAKMTINGDEIATGTTYSSNIVGDKVLLRSFGSGASNVAFSNLVIEEANDDGPFKIQAGENASDCQETAITADVSLSSLKLTSANVTTMENAQKALEAIDKAINQLASERAVVGSGMKRLMSQYDQVVQEHLTVSEAVHKIVDQDMAEASAEVTDKTMRFEISQQANKLHKDMLRERIRKLFIPI